MSRVYKKLGVDREIYVIARDTELGDIDVVIIDDYKYAGDLRSKPKWLIDDSKYIELDRENSELIKIKALLIANSECLDIILEGIDE